MIPKKYIDTQYTSVLFSPVFVSSHLRSFAANSLSAIRRMGYSSRPLISIFRSHNCFRMNTYFARFSRHLSPFRINTSGSVDSKQLYLPSESTLMKKRGRGDQLLLTRNSKKDSYPEEHRDEEPVSSSHAMKAVCPERPSGARDLSSNPISGRLLFRLPRYPPSR